MQQQGAGGDSYRVAHGQPARWSGVAKISITQNQSRPVVILCDVSGSMEQYSRVMLHFIHGLTQHQPSVHAFLFGTHLTNITRLMRYRDVDEAVQAVSKQVDDWSGGTLIGQSLQRFNRDWSRRVMAEGASVIIITDGLDRGPDEDRSALQKLHFEMERLHKSAYSLIWLNPLLRFDGFAPKSHQSGPYCRMLIIFCRCIHCNPSMILPIDYRQSADGGAATWPCGRRWLVRPPASRPA